MSDAPAPTHVFDISQGIAATTHKWVQEGNFLVCRNHPSHVHGSPIPQGYVLRKNEKGEMTLVKEY